MNLIQLCPYRHGKLLLSKNQYSQIILSPARHKNKNLPIFIIKSFFQSNNGSFSNQLKSDIYTSDGKANYSATIILQEHKCGLAILCKFFCNKKQIYSVKDEVSTNDLLNFRGIGSRNFWLGGRGTGLY